MDTSRLIIVEESPYRGGWGGTVASTVADEGFELLDGPIRRVAAACVHRRLRPPPPASTAACVHRRPA